MVDPTSPPNWLFDIFSWEHLSAVVTVFALLTTTAVVPVWQLMKKRRQERERIVEERETQKIKEMAVKITEPLVKKLEQHEQAQWELKQAQRENDRLTKETMTLVKDLVSEVHLNREQQNKLNAKMYFMDGYLRNRTVSSKSYKEFERREDDNNGEVI